MAVALVLSAACGNSADLSRFQAEILEDGEVTFPEMEAAVVAYRDCLLELGIESDADYDEALKAYRYRFSASDTNVDKVLNSPEGEECRAKFIDRVELAFADQVGPSQAEDAQFYADLADCMRAKGHEVEDSNPATLSRWYSQEPADYDACFDSAVEPG